MPSKIFMNTIKSIKVLSEFQVELAYTDGEIVQADFKPVIAKGGIFSQLNDPGLFKQAKIEADGRYLQWPNEIDFCADGLTTSSRTNNVGVSAR